jgi:hypothetical protein
VNKIKAQHDSAWKDILDHYLPQALEICFPAVYELIDWKREWVALDKELQSVTKISETGQRFVDKLIRVSLKENGSEQWVLIHMEVEQAPTKAFAERMFIYGIRLFDKYRHPIAGCALLTDDNKNIRPHFYEVGFGGTRLRQDFLLCKLIDFEKNRQDLESSSNPFATVVLFHLDALRAKRLPQKERFYTKINLAKRLYNKGFQKAEITNLFRFLDFSIALTNSLELEYQEEIHQVEVKRNMTYLSNIERASMQRGMEKGIEKGIEKGMKKGIQKGMERGMERGMEKGIKIGMQKGMIKNQEEIALELLKQGLDFNLIIRATKLKRKRLEELQRQLH